MRLIATATREELKIGDTVQDWRGLTKTIIAFHPPKPGRLEGPSEGRVVLRSIGQPGILDGDAEFYPSVIGAEITD